MQLLVEPRTILSSLQISLSRTSCSCSYISLLIALFYHLRRSGLSLGVFSAISRWSRLKEKVILHLLILIKRIRFLRSINNHTISSLEVDISWSSSVKGNVAVVVDPLNFVLVVPAHSGSSATSSLMTNELLYAIIQASLALSLVPTLLGYLGAVGLRLSCVRILSIPVLPDAKGHILCSWIRTTISPLGAWALLVEVLVLGALWKAKIDSRLQAGVLVRLWRLAVHQSSPFVRKSSAGVQVLRLVGAHSLSVGGACLSLGLPRRRHVESGSIVLLNMIISTGSRVKRNFVLANHSHLTMLTHQWPSTRRLDLQLIFRRLNFNGGIVRFDLLRQGLPPYDSTHYGSFILEWGIYLTVIQILLSSIVIIDISYCLALLPALEAILSLNSFLRDQRVAMQRYLGVGAAVRLLLRTASESFGLGVDDNILDILMQICPRETQDWSCYI